MKLKIVSFPGAVGAWLCVVSVATMSGAWAASSPSSAIAQKHAKARAEVRIQTLRRLSDQDLDAQKRSLSPADFKKYQAQTLKRRAKTEKQIADEETRRAAAEFSSSGKR